MLLKQELSKVEDSLGRPKSTLSTNWKYCADNYLNVDNQILTSQIFSHKQIIARVMSSPKEQSEKEDVHALPQSVTDKEAVYWPYKDSFRKIAWFA